MQGVRELQGGSRLQKVGELRETREGKPSHRLSCRRLTLNYLFMTAFWALFGFIYEMFSHGVFSPFMMGAFLIPLLFGLLPVTLLGLHKKQVKCPAAAGFWHGGIWMFTLGAVSRGALEIYGTTNSKLILLPISGAICLALAMITALTDRLSREPV